MVGALCAGGETGFSKERQLTIGVDGGRSLVSISPMRQLVANHVTVTFDRRERNFGPFAMQIGSALRTAQYRLKRKDLFQADHSSRFHLPVKSDSSDLINLSLSSGASPCEVRCGPRLSLLADEILSI